MIEFSKQEWDVIGRALDHYWHTYPIDEVAEQAKPVCVKVREHLKTGAKPNE